MFALLAKDPASRSRPESVSQKWPRLRSQVHGLRGHPFKRLGSRVKTSPNARKTPFCEKRSRPSLPPGADRLSLTVFLLSAIVTKWTMGSNLHFSLLHPNRPPELSKGLAVSSANTAIPGCPDRNRYSLLGAKGLFSVSCVSGSQADVADSCNWICSYAVTNRSLRNPRAK